MVGFRAVSDKTGQYLIGLLLSAHAVNLHLYARGACRNCGMLFLLGMAAPIQIPPLAHPRLRIIGRVRLSLDPR